MVGLFFPGKYNVIQGLGKRGQDAEEEKKENSKYNRAAKNAVRVRLSLDHNDTVVNITLSI